MRNLQVVYLGLNEHHRISWVDIVNRACVAWAAAGLHIDTIARWTHLTRAQVVYRLRKKGVSVTTYRCGQGPRAETLRSRYAIDIQKAWKAS